MGKETKIGLAVIAVLFVVFGIVVIRRLTRPAEEVAAADAAEKPSAAGKSEASADDSKSTSSAAMASRPTVLSAMKLSGGAARRAPTT